MKPVLFWIPSTWTSLTTTWPPVLTSLRHIGDVVVTCQHCKRQILALTQLQLRNSLKPNNILALPLSNLARLDTVLQKWKVVYTCVFKTWQNAACWCTIFFRTILCTGSASEHQIWMPINLICQSQRGLSFGWVMLKTNKSILPEAVHVIQSWNKWKVHSVTFGLKWNSSVH